MIIHPQGRQFNMGKGLRIEFAGDVVVMLFVTLIGLIPTLSTDMPQWNWYGFPDVYFGAQFLVHLVGFAAGGLVLARLVK